MPIPPQARVVSKVESFWPQREFGLMEATVEALTALESGPAYRFADFGTLREMIPGSGAGVYTIWDDEGVLVYAGVAGRNPDGKGLASRLRSHASGRRSGSGRCGGNYDGALASMPYAR
jgi:hypothetical protein